jgi:tRNA (cytidine/uridine-2'-O-)-methyltransferase
MFNIALIHPQIPQNTGAIGRLCVNTNSTLHIVKPIAFSLDEKSVRRAGLDYWKQLDLVVWESFEQFWQEVEKKRFFLATTKSSNLYFEAQFKKGDFLIFGSETKGIDEKILFSNKDRCITIPMGKEGRSLNLAMGVGIVTYEAIRQNIKDFEWR